MQQPATSGTPVEVEAYRLPQPLSEPVTHFSRDGQYAPRHHWQGARLDSTGFNFVASMDFSAKPAAGSIGVAQEPELPDVAVLDNCLRLITVHAALDNGGAVLHSAGLERNGRAYLFCGRSGVGKTTLCHKAAPMGCQVLSDDLNLVLPSAQGFAAHAVPFTGEYGRTLNHLGSGDHYPLAALVLLEQGEELSLESVPPAVAVSRLYVTSPFANEQAHQAEALMAVLDNMVDRVPVVKMTSSREAAAEDIFNVLESYLND
ncbi:hypothetical protein EY643_02380 [Halioglobus maricola]|uniref:HPr kinase/phosphorylase C-terminal domain-containing protein n=2 Tax=Halioglobus maricola TaxID=2601894 RepID=A0A5P9NFN2_9GAMM|nr:hypothetical protein EY643_02380 [Halioglobus maricola]